MADPRVQKFAKVMVSYALKLKPGDTFALMTHPIADELSLMVYEEAVKAGAHVVVLQSLPGWAEIFFKHATNDQLDFFSPVHKLVTETFDACLNIWVADNTRALSGVDPARIARREKAGAAEAKTFWERLAAGTYRWCVAVYPNNAMAQEADMGLLDYRDFVFGACMLDEEDPIACWRALGERQEQWVRWLEGRKRVVMKGPDIDLSLSIEGRRFISCDGTCNLPDGEIATAPVEDSANGWVRFRYPAIEYGQEIADIELWFEHGRIVREKAAKNQDLLTTVLNTDAGSRFLGELGIGTNWAITRFTKNMLFDEKIGGTIHLAAGSGIIECGSRNESGIHWDMLCDMNEAEIIVDGELFYKNGKPVVTVSPGMNRPVSPT